MKVTIIVLFCLFVFCGVGSGEIYKWTDEKGTVHFTEDPSTIPEKYRGSVKSRTTEEDLMTPEERLQEKRRNDEDVGRRQATQQTEYERSLEGERARKQMRDQEEAKHEERLRAEKEEKAHKLRESRKELVPERETQKQTLVKCQRCKGRGTITCSMCNGKGGERYVMIERPYGPGGGRLWAYRKCGMCDGTGQRQCPVCDGKGVMLR